MEVSYLSTLSKHGIILSKAKVIQPAPQSSHAATQPAPVIPAKKSNIVEKPALVKQPVSILMNPSEHCS
jgi:hypothetical protein